MKLPVIIGNNLGKHQHRRCNFGSSFKVIFKVAAVASHYLQMVSLFKMVAASSVYFSLSKLEVGMKSVGHRREAEHMVNQGNKQHLAGDYETAEQSYRAAVHVDPSLA